MRSAEAYGGPDDHVPDRSDPPSAPTTADTPGTVVRGFW